MPGLVPGIHVFTTAPRARRGWPGHLARRRASRFCPAMTRNHMSIFSKISTAADERSTRLAGIAPMLAGVWIFAFGDALGKVLVARYPVNELLLLRAAAPLAFLLTL